MSKATAEPASRLGDDAERGSVAGAEFERMVAAIQNYQRLIRPDAIKCRVVFYSPGGDELDRSSVPVPLFCGETTTAGKVIAFLSKLTPGEWAKGRVIAAEVEMEPEGGRFRKIMADLVKSETLDSGALGYRLKR